jgi:hypothetical protein
MGPNAPFSRARPMEMDPKKGPTNPVIAHERAFNRSAAIAASAVIQAGVSFVVGM